MVEWCVLGCSIRQKQEHGKRVWGAWRSLYQLRAAASHYWCDGLQHPHPHERLTMQWCTAAPDIHAAQCRSHRTAAVTVLLPYNCTAVLPALQTRLSSGARAAVRGRRGRRACCTTSSLPRVRSSTCASLCTARSTSTGESRSSRSWSHFELCMVTL